MKSKDFEESNTVAIGEANLLTLPILHSGSECPKCLGEWFLNAGLLLSRLQAGLSVARLKLILKDAYTYTDLEFGRNEVQTSKLYLSPALNQDDLGEFLLLFAFLHNLSFILQIQVLHVVPAGIPWCSIIKDG